MQALYLTNQISEVAMQARLFKQFEYRKVPYKRIDLLNAAREGQCFEELKWTYCPVMSL